MTYQTVTLQLPKPIYQSVWRTAKAVKRPLADVLVTVLKSSLPSLEGLPPELMKELTALESLSDAQLWVVARSKLSQLKQQQLRRLLHKNQAETLTEREQQALNKLILESEQLMLRKARAGVLLKWRGYAPAMA